MYINPPTPTTHPQHPHNTHHTPTTHLKHVVIDKSLRGYRAIDLPHCCWHLVVLHLVRHEIPQEGIKLVMAIFVDCGTQRPHQGEDEGGLGEGRREEEAFDSWRVDVRVLETNEFQGKLASDRTINRITWDA